MSNKIWPEVSKQNPCGICGHTDWCVVGDKAWCCMREPSDHPAKNGGYYHFFDDAKPKPTYVAPKRSAEPSFDVAAIMNRLIVRTNDDFRIYLSGSLGVSPQSVTALNAAWSPGNNAWAFPMRDGANEMIGIRLRDSSGKKWAIPGSRNGIFIPQGLDAQKTCFIVEGPTDCAAALTLGLFAIGKPSCNAGDDHVKVALKRLGVKRVVIISDNDKAGQLGARKLKQSLVIPSVIWTPPAKDLRAFLNAGGTKALVENSISKLVWTS
jgi:hypothetical protein